MRLPALVGALLLTAAAAEDSARITDEASAIAAAKRYTKAQCTESPCEYEPRREGNQWNVRVELTKRKHPAAPPQKTGAFVLLYFDREGHLVRRVQGEN